MPITSLKTRQGQELTAYLQYITRKTFGDDNGVTVRYGSYAMIATGSGPAHTNGVLVTFTGYGKDYPVADAEKKKPGSAVRWAFGNGNTYNENSNPEGDVSPTSKKVFWSGSIFTNSATSYSIAGEVEDLHAQALNRDPEGFKAAQLEAKRQSMNER